MTIWAGTTVKPTDWDSWDINQRIAWVRSASASGSQANTDNAIAYVIKEFAQQNYGALAAYLDDPTIGPILINAATHGWSQQQLQIAIGQTDWWKTTTDMQRQYDLLTRTDPASAALAVNKTKAQLAQIAAKEGITIADAALTKMAADFTRNGTSDPNLFTAGVLSHGTYNPTQGGQLGWQSSNVKALAAQYMVPLSDAQAATFAQQIETGQATQDGIIEYLKQAAQSRYPWMKDALNAGQSTTQIIDPYRQQTAQLLEVGPSQINMLDPKYSAIIDHVDAGSPNHRMMTLSEAAQYIKSTPDWGNTKQAKASVADLGETLLKTFGKVA